MSNKLKITKSFRSKNANRRTRHIEKSAVASSTSTDKIPRVSRLMALAIHFDELIQSGAVRDQAELARLGRVSRARLTQIMNLTSLAPEIQEAILFIQPIARQYSALSERQIRRIATLLVWADQRKCWSAP